MERHLDCQEREKEQSVRQEGSVILVLIINAVTTTAGRWPAITLGAAKAHNTAMLMLNCTKEIKRSTHRSGRGK